MSHQIGNKIKSVNADIRKIIEEVENSEVILPPSCPTDIVTLQELAVQLRNAAIQLYRAAGWTLSEISAEFVISPSRVSQIVNGKRINKTKRIKLR